MTKHNLLHKGHRSSLQYKMEEESIPQLQTKLSSTSQGFRKYFLLLFTKELIKQTKVEEFFTLNHVIKKKNKEVEEIENLRKEIEEAEKEKIRTGVFRPQRVLTPVKTYTAMQLPPQKQEEQFIPSLMHTEKPLVKQYTQPLPEQITQTLSQQPQVQQRTPMPRAPRIPPPLIIPRPLARGP